jgi:hypothetical protein
VQRALISMLPDYEPQLAGDYWVLPTIDHASGRVVRLHVSIAVRDVTDLRGSDVAVSVSARGHPLPVISGPSAGLLTALQLIGVNQFARYVSATPTTIGPSTSP